jgi:hypothetical protein
MECLASRLSLAANLPTKSLGCSTDESVAQASCSRMISDREHIILSMHSICPDVLHRNATAPACPSICNQYQHLPARSIRSGKHVTDG